VAWFSAESAPDIFTLWQRVPDTKPKYQYHLEREPLAVLPIKSSDRWWNKEVGNNPKHDSQKPKGR